ncbi:flavin reductase family protein [Priestia megaterium]|nr:flavin reductase family protein [Priestia megaterium]
MKAIDPSKQSTKENYHLLTSTVIPRPIAFVTTQSEEGIVNAAPFSFFNIVASEPPLIAISVGRQDGEVVKDTGRNIHASKQFVVHVVDDSFIEQVNQSAASYPSNVSEVEETGLTLVESERIQVPGIAEANIRFECELHQVVPLGKEDRYSSDLFIGEVVMFHVNEKVYENERVSAEKINPISRLGGANYSRLGTLFSLKRPK